MTVGSLEQGRPWASPIQSSDRKDPEGKRRVAGIYTARWIGLQRNDSCISGFRDIGYDAYDRRSKHLVRGER